MTDNLLLLEISNIMDRKLEPINNQLENIECTLNEDVLPRLQRLESTLDEDVLPRLQRLELNQENIIFPRLQTIESCYTSTYIRYSNGIEQLDTIQSDVEVMKKVISEHSEKLQKLA